MSSEPHWEFPDMGNNPLGIQASSDINDRNKLTATVLACKGTQDHQTGFYILNAHQGLAWRQAVPPTLDDMIPFRYFLVHTNRISTISPAGDIWISPIMQGHRTPKIPWGLPAWRQDSRNGRGTFFCFQVPRDSQRKKALT